MAASKASGPPLSVNFYTPWPADQLTKRPGAEKVPLGSTVHSSRYRRSFVGRLRSRQSIPILKILRVRLTPANGKTFQHPQISGTFVASAHSAVSEPGERA